MSRHLVSSMHVHHAPDDPELEIKTCVSENIPGHISRWINLANITFFFDDENSRRKFMGKIVDKFNQYLDDTDAAEASLLDLTMNE